MSDANKMINNSNYRLGPYHNVDNKLAPASVRGDPQVSPNRIPPHNRGRQSERGYDDHSRSDSTFGARLPVDGKCARDPAIDNQLHALDGREFRSYYGLPMRLEYRPNGTFVMHSTSCQPAPESIRGVKLSERFQKYGELRNAQAKDWSVTFDLDDHRAHDFANRYLLDRESAEAAAIEKRSAQESRALHEWLTERSKDGAISVGDQGATVQVLEGGRFNLTFVGKLPGEFADYKFNRVASNEGSTWIHSGDLSRPEDRALVEQLQGHAAHQHLQKLMHGDYRNVMLNGKLATVTSVDRGDFMFTFKAPEKNSHERFDAISDSFEGRVSDPGNITYTARFGPGDRGRAAVMEFIHRRYVAAPVRDGKQRNQQA